MFSKSTFLAILAAATSVAADCKCSPQDACWPKSADWTKLNSTISGHLLRGVPPASVCYAGALYNKEECDRVIKGWPQQTFHTSDPTSVLYSSWANDPCPPTTDPSKGKCIIGGYPVYIINATNAEAIQAGVNFAREHNVRLVVKNTGHDFLGRSTAPGSLSIWTHNLKSMDFHDSFLPKRCKTAKWTGKAVTLGAGVQMAEAYTKANEKGLVFVGGQDGTVGVGGYAQGGGHSPISAHFGLFVDQVLEMTVVTPDGKVVVANDCQNQDLYWAMRGGGGSTFGVLLDVTVKAFPTPKVTFAILQANLTANSDDALWDLLAEFNTHIPEFSDAGLLGYYISMSKGPFKSLIFMLHLLDRPVSDLTSIIKPFTDLFEKPIYKDNLSIGYKVPPMTVPDYKTYAFAHFRNDQVKRDGLLPSRLLPKSSLSKGNKALLKTKLKQAAAPTDSDTWVVGAMGAGKAVAAAHKASDMAVNPAWRKAYVHIFTMAGFPQQEGEAKTKALDYATNTMEQALIDLAPESGAYLNEANPYTKEFYKTFWGDNAAKLKQLKKKFDPKDVFMCRTCVGSENWVEQGDKICRK